MDLQVLKAKLLLEKQQQQRTTMRNKKNISGKMHIIFCFTKWLSLPAIENILQNGSDIVKCIRIPKWNTKYQTDDEKTMNDKPN